MTALSVLLTMLESMDSYTLRFESRIQQSSQLVADDQQGLIAALKAFRRFRGLPEEGDQQAISSLFSTSLAFADVDEIECPAVLQKGELPSGESGPLVGGAGDVSHESGEAEHT